VHGFTMFNQEQRVQWERVRLAETIQSCDATDLPTAA
jgi:hypothetical protein